jgi:putative FmdB family regulatory protein
VILRLAGTVRKPMPIYEYRCPEGHTFERFQSMTAPPPEKCDVCGASPIETVLFPVAIHYKGSGFYSTDYGKGKAAKADGESKGGGETKSDSKPDSKPASGGDSKPASSSSTSSD